MFAGLTLQAALSAAIKHLEKSSDSPRLDAELLLSCVLDRPRSYLLCHPQELMEQADASRYGQVIQRRANDEPVAYLTGHKEFWSLDLRVNDTVLIPRPDTETLVETALQHIGVGQPLTVADLGTGSGAIALALASERPACRIIACDRSHPALAVARGNAARLDLQHIEFHHGDWYQALAGERIDMVVSNPPYVSENDPHLEALRFEPRPALVAPANGLRCLRRLILGAPASLRPGGRLLLEHGPDQDDFVRRLMAKQGFVDIVTVNDLAGLPRVTGGRLPAKAA